VAIGNNIQIITGSNIQVSTSVVKYSLPYGGGQSASTIALASGIVASAGTINNLRVQLSGTPGSGKQYTTTIYKNGVAQSLSATVADLNTSANDLVNSVSFAAGDLISIGITPTGTPTSRYVFWGFDFIPTTPGETLLLASTSSVISNNSFASVALVTGSSITEFNEQIIIPCAGTIKKLYIRVSGVVTGGTQIFTVRKNGVDQILALTYNNGDSGIKSDLVNSFSVAAGDKICIQRTGTSTNNISLNIGLCFVPDTYGNFICVSNRYTNLNTATAEDQGLIEANGFNQPNGAFSKQPVSAFTLKNMYVELSGAPNNGAGTQAYIFTLMKNASAQALTITISEDATSGNITSDVEVIGGDLLGTQKTLTGTPTARTVLISYTGFLLVPLPLDDSLTISDSLAITSILSDSLSLSDVTVETYVPNISNLSAIQSTIDGKVNISYDVYFNHFNSGDDQVTITFQYWNGSSWEDCVTTVGEGLQTITPGILTNLIGTWTVKTDINGNYIPNCKIRVKVDYNGYFTSMDSSEFPVDTKNPVIDTPTPVDSAVLTLVPFNFGINITEDSSYLVKYEISILGGAEFNSIADSGWLSDVEIWNYVSIKRPFQFGTWYWKVTVKDIYQNQIISSIYSFTLSDSQSQIRVDNIVRNYDGAGTVKIYFSIKDLNSEKVNIRFDYTIDEDKTYHQCEIIEVSSGTIEEHNNLINLVATTSWVQYWAIFKYANDNDLILITNELEKKNLKIRSNVIITREGTDYDISEIVLGSTISKSKQLGTSQLTVDCADKDFNYNPNNENSNINLVSSIYNPLIYFGNKIKVIYKILTSSGIQAFTKFIGYIKNVEISKSSSVTQLSIVAGDNMSKLIKYMPNNLNYTCTKQEVFNELLRTFDGVTYVSDYTGWSEYPAPIIRVNDKEIENDKYIVDYARGQIIYKGNVLSSLTTNTAECTNPLADLKTWIIGIGMDNSILPKIYYTYELYQDYSVDYQSGESEQWVPYTDSLTEGIDYYSDFENGQITLYTALNADNGVEELGNRKNQHIVALYRAAKTATATYSYELPGTNDVEDIISDLALKAGISETDMQDTNTDEELVIREQKYLYTLKNNISSLVLKRNGDAVSASDYDLNEKKGIISLNVLDYQEKHKIIDDCDHLWDEANATLLGETVDQSIDIVNKEEGTGSLRVEFPTNGGNVKRNLLSDLYNVTITTQKYLEFYIKGDTIGIVYLDVSYDNSNWETKSVSITTAWQKVSWDISAFSSSFKDIKYLRLRGTNISINIDYIYLKRNLYTATYIYSTLQSTEITLSDVPLDYGNSKNAFEAIQELLKNCAPNYIVYVDDNNKLVGYYSSQKLFRNSLTIWSNVNQGQRAYSRSYYGEDYKVKLAKKLAFNISEEEVYTGVLLLGKNTEPENTAIKGTLVDDCTWAVGKAYALKQSVTPTSEYENFGKPVDSTSGVIIFNQLRLQNSAPTTGGINSLIDYDGSTGYFWYKKDSAPEASLLMCTLTLEKAIYWDKIDILVGAYDGKIIKEAFYIKVGDESGLNYWYTEKNTMKVQGGSTGSIFSFENNFNENIKIKYIRVYMSEPFNWQLTHTTVTTKSGFLKNKVSVSVRVEKFYAFSLGEIHVWEKAQLIAETRLDNVLLLGDGTTAEATIPNTPFKTKDYLLARWGWVNLYPETVKLYKNSLSTLLEEGVDYNYDKTTGIVTFTVAPISGDIISGTWVLDENNPKETTFYASFTNKDLIKRIGIKLYREDDEGLYTHLKCITRAQQILPELIRSVYPSSLDVVYRPDVKLGQSILIYNSELSLRRIFYIDSINLNMVGFVPSCTLGLTSFLELKDYEYQETDPNIYRDFKIYFPQFLMAQATGDTEIISDPDVSLDAYTKYYTGLIAIDALNEQGDVKLDYNSECKLEVLTIEDSLTFELLENTVKSEMWESGRAELHFYIQFNKDGTTNTPNIPTELVAEDKWYIDKNIVLRLYETDNPTKNKIFSTKVRLYLRGNLKDEKISNVGSLGLFNAYDNYIVSNVSSITTKQGKLFLSDLYNNFSDLGADSTDLLDIGSSGQSLYRLVRIDGNNSRIQYWDYDTSLWANYANVIPYGNLTLIGVFAGKFILRDDTSLAYVMRIWDGKTVVETSISYITMIYNNKTTKKLWMSNFGGDSKLRTFIYNEQGTSFTILLSGVAKTTQFSNILEGVGTHYELELKTGDYIKIGTETFRVLTVVNPEYLTLSSAYQGSTSIGLPIYKSEQYTQSHAWAVGTNPFIFTLGANTYMKHGTQSTVGWWVKKWNLTSHIWENVYTFSDVKELPVPRLYIEYRSKIYFIMTSYGTEKYIQPFLAEFDTATNKLYNKGYLINKDWGLNGTRAEASIKFNPNRIFSFQNNYYLVTDTSNIINITPLLLSSKREEIFPNQL